MIRTKFLSWLLRNFYKDYSIVFQTEHVAGVGILTRKPHVLVECCTVKRKAVGIFMLGGLSQSIIRDCTIYGRGFIPEKPQNPFQVDFSIFWQSIQKVRL